MLVPWIYTILDDIPLQLEHFHLAGLQHKLELTAVPENIYRYITVIFAC